MTDLRGNIEEQVDYSRTIRANIQNYRFEFQAQKPFP